jgi:hypothetical protein
MAGTPTKLGSRLAVIMVVIPMLALAYFISPFFLPRWRWENLAWDELALKMGKPRAQLEKTYQVVVRYAPRTDSDPTPWQILSSEPLYDPENDEPNHMVRVTLISDRSGEAPSKLRLGSGNYRDLFFTGTVWRLPPGTLGFNKFHPLVVYDGYSFEKLESNAAYRWSGEMKETEKWTSDDADIEDGINKIGENEP